MEKSLSKLWREAQANGSKLSFKEFAVKHNSTKQFANANGEATPVAEPVKQDLADSIYTISNDIKAAAVTAIKDAKQATKPAIISGCLPNCILYGSIGLAIGVVSVLILKRK